MPRNGSGVYSPTAGVPVVSGTTISSTAINNVLDDLGDEITASLPVSGVAPMTGVLRVTAGSASLPGLAIVGDTNTGLYAPGADQLALVTGGTAAVTVSATQTTAWSAKAVGKAFDVDAITDVASAATCDIGAAATSEVRITGTTTITAFGTSNAGIRRRGRFADALTLTHNGTSLILPGSANITTAANDCFEAVSLGSGNWIVTSYTKATGTSIVTQSITLGTPAASTSGTTVPFTGIPSWAKRVTLSFYSVSTNATSSFLVQIGSGSYDTSGYVSRYSSATTGINAAATETTGFLVGGCTAADTADGIVVLQLVNGSTNLWVCTSTSGSSIPSVLWSAGRKALSGALDRIRLNTIAGSDTFDTGTVNITYE